MASAVSENISKHVVTYKLSEIFHIYGHEYHKSRVYICTPLVNQQVTSADRK